MKHKAIKAIKTLAILIAVAVISSCGSKDGDGIYSDTKTITYGFQLDDASSEYVTAVIVYGDRSSLPQTVAYQGSAPWEISFSTSSGFSPFMYISLVKKTDVTPQTFPLTLSYQAGIVNGENYQSLSEEFTFDNLVDYEKFFDNNLDDDSDGN